MKREACDITPRTPNLLPATFPLDLAANRACSVLYDAKVAMARNGEDCRHVARHAHLMHAQDRFGACRDDLLDLSWVEVEGTGIDVNENRHRAAVTNHIRGGDVGMTNGDNFVARLDADREQRQMQRGGAV